MPIAQTNRLGMSRQSAAQLRGRRRWPLHRACLHSSTEGTAAVPGEEIMKTKIALIAILLMSCVTAYAQDFTIERGQTISGPEAQSPTDAPPGLQVNSQGANNLLIANYGHVIGPAGRGIIAHQRGPGSSTVIDSGVVRGEGVDCPGGEAGASRSSLHGMIGCSAIRNVITNTDTPNGSTEKTRVNKTAVGTSAGINNVNNGQGATIAVVGPHGRVNGIHEFGIENEITGNGTVSVRTDSGSLVRSGEGTEFLSPIPATETCR